MSRAGNRNRVKFTVTTHSESESSLDVLDEFIDWTHKKHLKSYIEIGKMLHISANDANRLLSRAVLPDKTIRYRMKELMYESKNHI